MAARTPSIKEVIPRSGEAIRRYYLTKIIGSGTWEDPFLPAVAEHGGDWGMIDLRPDSTKKAGYAIAYLDSEQPPVDDKIKFLALDSELEIGDEGIKQTVNDALASNLKGKTVSAILGELLIDGVTPGICKKIKPSKDGIKRIVLGGRVFYGPPLPAHKKGSITESFNKSDSDTLGPDLTWVEEGGDIDVVSNQAVTQGASQYNFAYADEGEPFTDDHYSQILMVGKGNVYLWGVTVRCEDGGQYDWYLFDSNSNNSRYQLRKRVDGTITGLVTESSGWSDPDNDTFRLEANGSSLIGKVNGEQVISTTDSSITGNTKCGFGGYHTGHTFDNFEAGDLNVEVTGWKSPGTVANVPREDNEDWENYNNVKEHDENYAVAYPNEEVTDYLRCTNFDFSEIPNDATLIGVEVRVNRKAESGGAGKAQDSIVSLRKSTGQVGDNKADTVTDWPNSFAYKTYGALGDLWNSGLTISDLKNSATGVDFSAYGGLMMYTYVEHLEMRIHYALPYIYLAGAIAGQAALQGALSAARKIAGAIAAQSGVSGALKISRELTGAIASQSSVQGALKLSKALTGTVAGQSLVQGVLGLTKGLAGVVAAQSGVSGTLSLGAEEELAGTIGGQTTVEGNLTVEKGLTGEVAAQTGVAGELSRILGLAGTIAAQSSVAGELTGGEVLLSGIIAAEATIEGGLSGIWRITGAVAAKVGVEGVLTVPGPGQRQSGMFLVM